MRRLIPFWLLCLHQGVYPFDIVHATGLNAQKIYRRIIAEPHESSYESRESHKPHASNESNESNESHKLGEYVRYPNITIDIEPWRRIW